MIEHITCEDLAAFADGMLKGEKKARVESHLSHCPECLEILAEIVVIQDNRAKVPKEFVSRALGEKQAFAKTIPPLRLVFGMAAVFLVMVFVGTYFLGNNRSWRNETEQQIISDLEFAKTDVATPAETGKPSHVLAGQAEEKSDFKARLEPKAKGALDTSPAAPLPQRKSQPVATPMVAEPELADEAVALEKSEMQEPLQSLSGALEKDKFADMKMAESRSAAVPGLARKAIEIERRESSRSRAAGKEAAAGVVQLFLAATGRAAAPLAMNMTVLGLESFVRIDGDVGWSDLRNPGRLDEWLWFQKGMVLELAIGPDGAVSAVSPVGPWERQVATQAVQAGKELFFSVSDKKIRRAVLTVWAGYPN
jgi:anti-sigma factor RsiW